MGKNPNREEKSAVLGVSIVERTAQEKAPAAVKRRVKNATVLHPRKGCFFFFFFCFLIMMFKSACAYLD